MKRKERDLSTLLATVRPSMAIFDLDHTLWRGNCDDFVEAQVVSPTEVSAARSGHSLHLCPDVPQIFAACATHGVPIAIASAASATDTAVRLLRSFRLQVVFTQIYRGKKDEHLRAIAAKLKKPLDRAIFLDDSHHNIKTAQALGVGGCVLVKDGLTEADVAAALEALQQKHRGSTLMRSWLSGGGGEEVGVSVGGSSCGRSHSSAASPPEVGGSEAADSEVDVADGDAASVRW